MLVDPGKLTLNFDHAPLPNAGLDGCIGNKHAEGVLTVAIRGHAPQSSKAVREGENISDVRISSQTSVSNLLSWSIDALINLDLGVSYIFFLKST